MVKKHEKSRSRIKVKDNIRADVIILGCSLPGIVTAHKLKKRFGDTMDIVVLDLDSPLKAALSKGNVAFQEDDEETECQGPQVEPFKTSDDVIDNVARFYIARLAKDFNIPLPEPIMAPEKEKTSFNKLFQYRNGAIVICSENYHDFEYLNMMERLELNQYQRLLDHCMRDLFQTFSVNKLETTRLRYYDQTTMETHICDALVFSNSRDIMRNTVSLVCGASPNTISVLFYLHQCYRTASSRNHLDGNNTRFREKLLGYCRKRLASKLQQSVADITLSTALIKEIRTYSDEQVILETIKGETNYVCTLLAMALRPDELHKIRVESQLLSEAERTVAKSMKPGCVKKFVIKYKENFWRNHGYSGDILSVRGPIIWAMENPKLSTTGSMEKYSSLIGYLKMHDKRKEACSQEAVLEQLAALFGEEALSPVSYREVLVSDLFIPCCGDYITLRAMITETSSGSLEWAAFDIFADGDVAAALEAGNLAYTHLLACLRPQAQTFEDVAGQATVLRRSDWGPLSYLNYMNTMRLVAYSVAAYTAVKLVSSYWKSLKA